MAELVAAAGLGHGAERRAAEVEVILGHGVVVHVSDDHRLRVAGAGIVVLASYLEKKKVKRSWLVESQNYASAFSFSFPLRQAPN